MQITSVNIKYLKKQISKKNLTLHKHEVVLLILSTIYFLYFTFASFVRHESFYSYRFDLGNMDQTIWNTLHGNIFIFTDPYGTEQISRLAYHADIILVLLSPLYLIWSDPKILLVLQSFVLALGGILIYLIANMILKNKGISLVLAAAFYLNPSIQHSNLFDFHGVVLGTTFLLAAFYFILKKKWWWVIIFIILAGISKEQVWGVTALLGLYIFFISKKRLLGLLITAPSIILFVLFFWIIIPSFSVGGNHFALKFLEDFGSTPTEIVLGILFNPIELFNALVTQDNITYLNTLFFPLGYTSLVGFPFLIFAAPDLAINLISDNESMKGVWNQYTATITPFIFIASIYGIKFLVSRIKFVSYKSIAYIIFAMTLISAHLHGPLLSSTYLINYRYVQEADKIKIINEKLDSFPQDTIISVTNNLGAHVSQRKDIYIVQFNYEAAEYAVLLIRKPYRSERDIFAKITKDPNFELDYQNDNFYIFKRIDP